MAKLLLQSPDVLVLDEPTNYLDVSHIDWLVDYLNNFDGAFIVVSHDYDFLGRITNCIIDIDFGTITRYTGTLKQALRQKAANRETYLKAYANQQRKIAKTEAYIRKNKAGTRAKSAKSREKQLARMDVLTPPKKTTARHALNFHMLRLLLICCYRRKIWSSVTTMLWSSQPSISLLVGMKKWRLLVLTELVRLPCLRHC